MELLWGEVGARGFNHTASFGKLTEVLVCLWYSCKKLYGWLRGGLKLDSCGDLKILRFFVLGFIQYVALLKVSFDTPIYKVWMIAGVIVQVSGNLLDKEFP